MMQALNHKQLVFEMTMSEFTRSVLVLRLSWKCIGRGLNKFNIFKYAFNRFVELTRNSHCIKKCVSTVLINMALIQLTT